MSLPAVEPLACGRLDRFTTGRLLVRTPGLGFTEITRPVTRFVAASGIGNGLATLFCRHTSASLLLMENADPDVLRDLAGALHRLAPRRADYVHGLEGPDDMPAHIRTLLTGVSLAVPVLDGTLALGRWQGLFLAEHRDAPHAREVLVSVAGGARSAASADDQSLSRSP